MTRLERTLAQARRSALMQLRVETLYRVIYESFTPRMMHWTPLWLKKRIATTLGWHLVRTLEADAWLRELFLKRADEPAPIALATFESCAGKYGGRSARELFNRKWLWRQAKRIWAGDTRKMAADNKPVPGLKAPGMLPEDAEHMDTGMNRRRFHVSE